MHRGSYPIQRMAARAYPSVDGTKKDDLRIDAIFVATYNGTYEKKEDKSNLENQNYKETDPICSKNL